eukprot:TRINITY_DN8838_c0_g1_i1.p1 TRINITY_DN8838_c0_g1~~TRINITY_DN8838_c0_g1_i1.p1  ORF type:complete len:337 (+),score=45.78 TRINITY_DN8838_c0_g1_i1:64-1074(+)
MLSCTMGAATSFEQRRKAIAHRLHRDSETISDDQVVEDYLNSVVKPDGFVREYLEHANIAVCLGNTLFVHGAVTDRNIGFLPSTDNREAVQEVPPGEETIGKLSAREWIQALNSWGKDSFEQWKHQPQWNSDRTSRGGHAIMGYYYARAMSGVPPKGARTVTITDWLVNGHPKGPSSKVGEYLNQSGLYRVMTGHKPFGDSPAIMRSSSSSSSLLEVVSADTSYSDTSAEDMRGIAVSEVLIQGTLEANQARVHGVFKDGTEFDFVLPALGCSEGYINTSNSSSLQPGDEWIGKETPCGWWVKAKQGQNYVLVKGSGHKVEYKKVALSDIPALFVG